MLSKRNRKYIILFGIFIIVSIILYYWIDLYETQRENFESLNPKDEMSKYSVIFAGTVRDVEPHIEKILNHIEKCGKKFKKYAVIIYENDSKDKTRQLLLSNKKDNYYYILEHDIKEPKRTIRLANGRNKILNAILENNLIDYDYMIMIDMDDVNVSGRFIDSIETCFKYDSRNWDVQTGNQSDHYYDLWALRMKNVLEKDYWEEFYKLGNEEEKKNYENKFKTLKFEKDRGLIEVNSSFGGIGIYKIKSFLNKCEYFGYHKQNNPDNYPVNAEKCEHVDFHDCIKRNGGKIFINTEFFTY